MLSNQRCILASIQDEAGKTPLHVAVLNNQVETVRKLLRKYSKDDEIQDRNNKYPYQYAIDNCNREILELFSNYYEKRKAEIGRTVREFEDKVAKCGRVKKVSSIINRIAEICYPICVGITALTARSKSDMLHSSITDLIWPNFYKVYQYVHDGEDRSLNTDNKIPKILLDLKMQECKHLTDEARIKVIGEIKDLSDQVKNDTLELSEKGKHIQSKMEKLNVKGISGTYSAKKKALKTFVDYPNIILAVFSAAFGIMALFHGIIEWIHSHYSWKCTLQYKLLDQINKKLKEINFELKMEDRMNRVNRKIEKIEMMLEKLQSSIRASSNVESDDSQLNAAIQKIRINMESVEVESAFASNLQSINERA